MFVVKKDEVVLLVLYKDHSNKICMRDLCEVCVCEIN